MRPARQGDFDGLCGVYSIMNALELVGVGGPRRALHRHLFYQLTRGLGPPALLRGMKSGLTASDLKRAARHAFKWLDAEYGMHLKLTQPFATTEFFDASDFLGSLFVRSLKLDATAIIQLQTHGSAHWTVVESATADGLVLRDSRTRPASILLSKFTLDRGPRFFRPAETLFLSREN